MEITQYKITYLKHGQEQTRIFFSITEITEIEESGFKLISITPQLVVDQLAGDDLIIKLKKEYKLELKKQKIKELEKELSDVNKKAKELRTLISIEHIKPTHN